MAPSPSPDRLLDLAEASIVDGLAGRPPHLPPLADLPSELRTARGTFVTLTVDGSLNGCIGTIEGAGPLGHARRARYDRARHLVVRAAEAVGGHRGLAASGARGSMSQRDGERGWAILRRSMGGLAPRARR